MLKHLANFLTCCNLLCGCFGIVQAFENNLTGAAYFIWIGGIFDFFDGFAARLFKGNSELGKQLDSLADVVTFGVLPGVIMFGLLKQSFSAGNTNSEFITYVHYIAFLIPVFSALRLAKFNIDTRQSEDFIGLNTPANAFFFSSFPFILLSENSFLLPIFSNQYVIIGLIILFSGLLISEIRIFGFKFKDYSFSNNKNKTRYFFLLASILLIITFKFSALPLIIILYITLSLIQQFLIKRT